MWSIERFDRLRCATGRLRCLALVRLVVGNDSFLEFFDIEAIIALFVEIVFSSVWWWYANAVAHDRHRSVLQWRRLSNTSTISMYRSRLRFVFFVFVDLLRSMQYVSMSDSMSSIWLGSVWHLQSGSNKIRFYFFLKKNITKSNF